MTLTALKSGFFEWVNWKALFAAMLFAVLFLLVYYVWQISYLTNGTYLISHYQRELAGAMGEKRGLEVNFAESGFLGEVQEKIQQMNFQKTISVTYIQLPETETAFAK